MTNITKKKVDDYDNKILMAFINVALTPRLLSSECYSYKSLNEKRAKTIDMKKRNLNINKSDGNKIP